jgi:hypothetical protein
MVAVADDVSWADTAKKNKENSDGRFLLQMNGKELK